MSVCKTHEVYPSNLRLVLDGLPLPEGLYQLLQPPLLDFRVHIVLHNVLYWDIAFLDHYKEALLLCPGLIERIITRDLSK